MKTCMWDIESTALNGSFGHILCSCFRFTTDSPSKVHTVWTDSLDGEGQMLGELVQLYTDADIIVTWNGLNFDRRFVNSRLLRYNMDPLPPRFHIDLLHLHRYYFRTNGHRLDTVLKDLDCAVQKFELRAEEWQQAADPKHPKHDQAMSKLIKHCKHDVLSLEEVFYRMKPYIHRMERR